ncbi:pyridoxal-phosphate dependent enzyme [Sedimentitalea todarodis]|uniref:Pyridoxal-phosphate dependent enzyme n=1 Tax=Sedimentitalea todarodis TaxID=1631240 RepID=A0ABU3VGH7_9RHOB|nr:pyridoxal-phosphate dependent enzyme [Sedimentitalea todarodis]MDU9005284.1 pyridoxal-phosphate dependent enzyme [Sedimentitalea todarodis]
MTKSDTLAMPAIDTLSFHPNFTRALEFFQTQELYTVSPMHEIAGPDGLTVYAKDETQRMGLGAFKALGAPYAVAQILAHGWLEKTGETLTPERMTDADVREFAATHTFVCASAGNHGMGVAAGARAMGAKARIYLAETVPAGFAGRLEALGAEVVRSGEVYEDSVAEAIADAERTGDTLLADGTWEGYTEIPKWVMEGYCVIAEELRVAFEASGRWPTHVYLQAGVGGLAAAMAHMIRLNWAEQPELIIAEPEAAACLKASHLAGEPTRGAGPESNMGRLDCKDPSIVAWSVLERCDVSYETLTEEEGQAAADALAAIGVATTPSGAAGYGALCKRPVEQPNGKEIRPLVIISEGPA